MTDEEQGEKKKPHVVAIQARRSEVVAQAAKILEHTEPGHPPLIMTDPHEIARSLLTLRAAQQSCRWLADQLAEALEVAGLEIGAQYTKESGKAPNVGDIE